MGAVVGGIVEQKTIGINMNNSSGTHVNTEFVNGKLQLKQKSEVNGTIEYFATGNWTSDIINIGDNFKDYGKVVSTTVLTSGTTVSISTRTSDDGITFDSWTVLSPTGDIQSIKRQFIQTNIALTAEQSVTVVILEDYTTLTNTDEFENGEYLTINGFLKMTSKLEQLMVIDTSTQIGTVYKTTVDKSAWKNINTLIIDDERVNI